MYHGAHYAPTPSPSQSPPQPTLNCANSAAIPSDHHHHTMLLSIFLALFLPCVGMSVVFLVYIFLLWYATGGSLQTEEMRSPSVVKPASAKGLSTSDLEKLPRITGKELVMGTECAVCLDEIENEQPARLVPGCNHGFHLQCADAWLSKHSACPVCRAKLDPQFLDGCLENPC